MKETIPGAAALGLSHWQCIDLMERAEDTLHGVLSCLSYLIHQEQKKKEPDQALITEWQALEDEVTALDHDGLLYADVETYQRVINTYRQRYKELDVVVDSYTAAES